MHPDPAPAFLELVHGELRVQNWPPGLRPPHGMAPHGSSCRGLPRLRSAVRARLSEQSYPFTDRISPPPLADDDRPAPPAPLPTCFAAWLSHGARGIVAGLPDVDRCDAVVAAIHATRCSALVVVRDSGAASQWESNLRERCRAAAFTVVTAEDAAHTMYWRATRHDLLVLDRPEQVSAAACSAIADLSAANHRLSFVDTPHPRQLLDWTARFGGLVAVCDSHQAPLRVGLRLPLTGDERADHDAAWHEFLRAFDAFVALRPEAGFGTFVQEARSDPRQRPALFAWHRARRAAAWNQAKERTVGDLLVRHRGQRVLVFTPDRASCYRLAREHLIAPVTAELPRAERDGTLAAFRAGRLFTLVGPRLLDLGVPERSADVGILVAADSSAAVRSARLARIRTTGIAYELFADDTLEVGRAHRHHQASAHPDVGRQSEERRDAPGLAQ